MSVLEQIIIDGVKAFSVMMMMMTAMTTMTMTRGQPLVKSEYAGVTANDMVPDDAIRNPLVRYIV